MKIFLLLFFLSFVFIYPQENNNGILFKNYIPDIIKNNNDDLNQILENIEVTALLHPSLLYYYFEHLDLRFNHNITKPDSNFSRILYFHRNEFRKKRNDFALSQEQWIEKKKFVMIKENAMISCFDDLFTDYDEDTVPVQDGKSIDKNKQDFYSLVYLKGNNEEFNPDKDYSKILNEEIQTKVEYFKNGRMNFNTMNKDEKVTFINDMNKHWYFFETGEEYFNQKLEFQPNELAQEIFMNDFFINENFSTQLFYHPINKNNQTEETADILTIYKATGSTGSGRNINTKINMKLEHFFSVFGGYRIKLENEYATFSFIDFNLGFSINQIDYDPSFGSTFFEMEGARPGELIDANGIIEKESGFTYSILSKLSVPIFYLNKNFYFKIGVLYEFRSNSFNYSTKINETITDLQGNKTLTIFKENGSFSSTTHLAMGLISFNSSITNNIDFVLEGNISKKIGISFGIGYNF